jgi:hypothetical protein
MFLAINETQAIHIFGAGAGNSDHGPAVRAQGMQRWVAALSADPFAPVFALGNEAHVEGVDFPEQDLKAIEPGSASRLDRGDGVTLLGFHPGQLAVFRAMECSGHAAFAV